MSLFPLHSALFNLLKRIPQDGTFNQSSPIKLLCTRGFQSCYSYDLSSATDRLPVLFQEQVLGLFLGQVYAESWRKLLSLRGFSKVGADKLLPKDAMVHYAVGQPMGAYSSWAMLALTHHFIVQLAALRAGHKH
jgi:hypothetical protein